MDKTQWVYDLMGKKYVLIHEQKQNSHIKIKVIGWVDSYDHNESRLYESCKIIGGQRAVVGQHKTLDEAKKTVEMGI